MENIRFGRLDATDEEVIHAAQMADADHFIRQLPEGYQTVLSERAGNLTRDSASCYRSHAPSCLTRDLDPG